MKIYRIEHAYCRVQPGHGPAAGYICSENKPLFGSAGPTPEGDFWYDMQKDQCNECNGTGTIITVGGWTNDWLNEETQQWVFGEYDPTMENIVECYKCDGTGISMPTLRIRGHEVCGVLPEQLDFWWSYRSEYAGYPARQLRAESGWRICEYEVLFAEIQIGRRQVVFCKDRAVKTGELDDAELFIALADERLATKR